MLPQVSPSPLTSLKEHIGHPNWIYELKHDGFRGILYIDRDQAWLVSRKGKKFRQFDPLLKQVLRSLKGQRAILDGEIVVLDEKGRSNFYDLMARRGEPRYYAFDLVWLNRQDLGTKPLLERKRMLRRLIPPNDSYLLYVDHLEGDGARFFALVCELDLEGIICKPRTSRYLFTWIKVKNPNYSQAVGRREWFERLLTKRSGSPPPGKLRLLLLLPQVGFGQKQSSRLSSDDRDSRTSQRPPRLLTDKRAG